MSVPELDFASAERLLEASDFLDCRLVWSSNVVYLAQLRSPDGQTFAAIYKPRKGERPLWDFPDGTLYLREVAAYRFARMLGWPLIPPTVIRDGPDGVGALQVFIRHDPSSHFFVQREDPALVPALQRMVLFDYVANNADRKGGHCLLDTDGRLWGIDHGLCFHAEYKLRTVMWDWAGDPIPQAWLDELRAVRDRLRAPADAEAKRFLELLAPDEEAALVRRIEAILRDGRFPLPGPHRSYPWPLV